MARTKTSPWRVGAQPYYGPNGVIVVPVEPVAPEARPWLWGFAALLVGGAVWAVVNASRLR